MWQYQETVSLCHHGIKGQKWGVRRYQNYDGSYTKKGLARYNSAKESYDKADADYRSGNGSKQNLKKAKTKLASAKKKLKTDYKADHGKELYGSGKTIEELKNKQRIINIPLLFATGVSTKAIGRIVNGAFLSTKSEQTKKLAIAGAAVVAAVSGASAFATSVKTDKEIKNLKAYYAHSGGK